MCHYAVPVIVGREDLGEKKILIIRHFLLFWTMCVMRLSTESGKI